MKILPAPDMRHGKMLPLGEIVNGIVERCANTPEKKRILNEVLNAPKPRS